MPPKKSQLTKQTSKEKQIKLFSKQVSQPQKLTKTKSKQFKSQQAQQIKTCQGRWEYGNGKTPDKIFISSWNVNGIRSVINKQQLPNYLTKYKPDILCVGQTKIDQAAFDKIKIKLEGYHGYWNFCKCSAGYSGVAIFSKYLPISVKQDLPQSQHSQQGRVITMQFQKFYLITAYIPNSGAKLQRLSYRVQQYDKCFQNYCQDLKKKKTVIICGDLNVAHRQIDIARPQSNLKCAGFTVQQRESFTQFLEKGWIDSFRKLNPQLVKYSWWSMRSGGRQKNIGWRLDYFLINQENWQKVKDSRINNEVYGSDHCPVQLQIQFSE